MKVPMGKELKIQSKKNLIKKKIGKKANKDFKKGSPLKLKNIIK